MTNQTKSLFQYRPPKAWAYENLCSYNIYFSPLVGFNDPFDYRAPPELSGLQPKQLAFLRQTNPDVWGDDAAHLPDDKFIARVNEKLPQLHETIIQTCGVACFSKRNDSLLMWSHYAGGDRGFCLEFDRYRDIDRYHDKMYQGYDVDYSGNFPPAYDYAKAWAEEYGTVEYASLLLKHKKDMWKYEEEVRMFRGKVGKVSYHPQSLKAIYLGSAATKETERLIRTIITKEEYQHVNFKKANPNKDRSTPEGFKTLSRLSRLKV